MSATLDEILDRAVYRFGPLARLCALVDGTLAQMHGGAAIPNLALAPGACFR